MSEHTADQYVAGITLDLNDDVIVTDVVIIAKTVHMETGLVGVYLTQTAGMSWIEKIGLLRAAERIETADLTRDDD